MRAPLLAGLLVLLAPTLLASVGSAQVPIVATTLTVTVLDPGGNGLPVGGEGPGIMVAVTYDEGPGGAQMRDPTTGDPVPTRITFEVTQLPSWVNATRFDPPHLDLKLPTTGNAAGNVSLYLTIVADAPARQREELVVVATAAPNGNLQGTSAESPPLKLRPRVVTKVNVTAAEESPVFVSGGRWVSVPFMVRNDGNDEVTTLLNVTTRPEDSQIEIPNATLTVPRGGSATVEVRMRMPWTYGSQGTLELEALPIADEEVPAARASVDIQAASAVPGPHAGVLVVGFVALALLRRRASTR